MAVRSIYGERRNRFFQTDRNGWPVLGRYIGTQNPELGYGVVDMSTKNDAVECFVYQSCRRVYGDEIQLDKSRISKHITAKIFDRNLRVDWDYKAPDEYDVIYDL